MEQTQENNIVKLALAGLALWGINKIINYEEEDTVNYTLCYKGKIVYVGVCFIDRLDARLREHRRDGKIFTSHTHSRLKKGSLALYHEEIRIKKYRPKYNLHHNW